MKRFLRYWICWNIGALLFNAWYVPQLAYQERWGWLCWYLFSMAVGFLNIHAAYRSINAYTS